MTTDGVEARGATVADAIAEALMELGLPEEAVDVEVIAERGKGLFSARRAHVRITPKPTPHPPAQEEHVVNTDTTDTTDERSADETTEDAAPAASDDVDEATRLQQLDEEADLAADFIEGLLDHLDLPGDIEIQVDVEAGAAMVTVQDVGSGLLIGRRGQTLESLQELVRCAVQRQTEQRSHVRVDVEGYKTRQIEKLRDRCREAIAQVRESGEPVHLEPMDAYERKLMHDLIARTGGVESSSEGNEPRRHVVIHPAT